MSDFESELKIDFLNEAKDLLSQAENAFLKLDPLADNLNLLNEIFRMAHNLKGTSMAVGFEQLSEVTHVAENLILKLKDGAIQVSDEVINVLLIFKDKVNEMISGLQKDLTAKFDTGSTITSINGVINGGGAAPKKVVELPIETSVAEEVVIEPIKMAPPEKKAPAPTVHADNNDDDSIRVKTSRIDKINNIIGELVILQTVLEQRSLSFIKDDLSNKSINQMSKLFKEVQEISMSLRMVPLKPTFQKMIRIVRDTSKLLNKKVNLVLKGEDNEIDKTVLEHLADPLVHIIRNAVDHGLELPEDRVKANKNDTGTVEIMAYHEGSNLIIQVTDDGKGINPEVIKNKAVQKGILRENTNLSENEIIQLIFHPGFSTKEQVTEVSGRGVGMDVVKTNVEQLGGDVRVVSKVGTGSSFKIVLPLTLAIVDGLVIHAGIQKYVIPLGQVHEVTTVKKTNITKVPSGGFLFTLRGEVFPLFYLGSKIGSEIKLRTEESVMMLRGTKYPFGVVIDEIINQQQVVIKKLGDEIKELPGVMGAAILGDGKPAIILDIYEIFKNDLKESVSFKKINDIKLAV